MTARRLSRRAVVVALIGFPLAGATLAAATHSTDRSTRFVAETALVVSTPPDGRAGRAEQLRQRSELLVSVLRLPVTEAAAAVAAGADDPPGGVARRLTILSDPRAGIVRVRATGATPREAVTLAEAAASEGVRLARVVVLSATGRPMDVVGDFEEPATGWQAQSSLFNLTPKRVTRITDDPKTGGAALRTECPPEPGCGPGVRVDRLFRAGTEYAASGYARSSQGSGARLKMVLGSSGADVRTGAAIRLTRRWQRLTVSWTPREDAISAELGFQLADRRRTIFDVDSVLMPARGPAPALELPEQLDPREELLALDLGRFVLVSSSRVVAENRSAPVGWALAGLGAGLLVALASVAAGRAAQSRAEQAD